MTIPMGKEWRLGLSMVCVVLSGLLPTGIAWAEEPPPPTPVPLLGGEMAEGNGFIVPMAGETWSAIAYWFYSSSTGLKANYQCSQSTPSANSQQIWCDATYRGYYGST